MLLQNTFLIKLVMTRSTISLRLHEDELVMLTVLSKKIRMTKSEIIRSSLRPLFDRYFDHHGKIVLSNCSFQKILDEIDKNLSEQDLKRREEIRKYIIWR